MKDWTRKGRAAVAAIALLALTGSPAGAYPTYEDGFATGCVNCHSGFQSVGPLHNSHTINFQITQCNVCHRNGGGSQPVYTYASGPGGGFGCVGCHGQDYGQTITSPVSGQTIPWIRGFGLRQVHADAGVTICAGCHTPNPFPVLDETTKPPYYPMHVSDLRDPCSAAQEDLPYDMDSKGLDNDGNGVADYVSDANCVLPSTTTTTTSTTTTTTLPVECGPTPMMGCIEGAKAKVIVKEIAPNKGLVKFLLAKLVPAVTQSQFGSPVSSDTSYALCVYDQSNALAGAYGVARGSETCGSDPCWSAFKTTGFRYGDKALASDGILKMQLYGGDAGKGKILVLGKNTPLVSNMPNGAAALLSGDTSATVQLVTSDSVCFGMTLGNVKKADGSIFIAGAP